MVVRNRLFDGTANHIANIIALRKKEYREFFNEQAKMAQFSAFHVSPLKIKDIDFMSPLENWEKMGLTELEPVLAWIVKRIYQPDPRQNCVMMINGQTGSGKSYSAISLGLLTDDQFDIDSICFSLREMRDQVDAGKKTIILDDVETYAHSRDSMTKLSKWLAKYFDMVRAKRNFFILTAPSYMEVEKVLRERAILQGITKGINPVSQETIMRTFFIEKDPNEGKIYRHLPIIYHPDSKIYKKIPDIRIKKPADEIINQYEEKKLSMFHKLGKKLNKIDKRDEIDDGTKTVNDGDKKKKPIYQICMDEMINGLTPEEIADKHNLSKEQVRLGIIGAKRAGYRLDELDHI